MNIFRTLSLCQKNSICVTDSWSWKKFHCNRRGMWSLWREPRILKGQTAWKQCQPVALLLIFVQNSRLIILFWVIKIIWVCYFQCKKKKKIQIQITVEKNLVEKNSSGCFQMENCQTIKLTMLSSQHVRLCPPFFTLRKNNYVGFPKETWRKTSGRRTEGPSHVGTAWSRPYAAVDPRVCRISHITDIWSGTQRIIQCSTLALLDHYTLARTQELAKDTHAQLRLHL